MLMLQTSSCLSMSVVNVYVNVVSIMCLYKSMLSVQGIFGN